MCYRSPVSNRSCQNSDCDLHGQFEKGNIVNYGFFKLKRGRRRRYRCNACGQTFSFTKGTPYYRIQRSRNVFDEVCALSVEGVNKSAIARVKRLTWNNTLRGIRPDLPVIALSGWPEARRASLDAGADAFVSKGDPPEQLLAAINSFGPDGTGKARRSRPHLCQSRKQHSYE